jgi:hypothetical protein
MSTHLASHPRPPPRRRQDTVLFNDTVLYNIRYGRPAASDSEVRGDWAGDLVPIHQTKTGRP